jgi:hypothetical protein
LTSLLVSALRLLLVVAFCLWLPGWVACGTPARRVRIPTPLTVGFALHIAALVGPA